jgi:Tfp pilus assembly protein PilZ
VAKIIKTKVIESVSDEQAQAEADLMNAKILEAAQKQHISATAVFRVPKGKKGPKKPQQKWVKKGEKQESQPVRQKVEEQQANVV